MTFWADEWAVIESRSLSDIGTWFAPHNEHWITLWVVVYRALVESLGLGSYVPYILLVAALHVGVAGLAYVLIRRAAGRLAAVAGAGLVLFFGSGFENIYWGFQGTLVGSVMFGLAALVIIDGPPSSRRALAIAGALLASLMLSGVGVAMCAMVAIEMMLRPPWRRLVATLAIPACSYVAWYATFGNVGIDSHRDPFTIAALVDTPGAIIRGLGNAGQSITGLPWEASLVVTIGSVTVAVSEARHGRTPVRFIAALGGIMLLYALVGLVRSHEFDSIVDNTRYTYVSGIVGLVGLADLWGRVVLRLTPRRRLIALQASASLLILALTLNAALLMGGRHVFIARADMTRALISVALDPDRPPEADLDRSLVLVPAPRVLERIVSTFGDPRHDQLRQSAPPSIPPAVLEEATQWLLFGPPPMIVVEDRP
jgi:hypothetical protein